MTYTLADIRTKLRNDVLSDAGSTSKWSDPALLRMINGAIDISFPRLFVYGTDTSIPTTYTTESDGRIHGVTRYTIPSLVPTYPQACPIYRVQLGPIGGQLVSDASKSTDIYQTIKGPTGRKAWEIDWANRQIVFAYELPYDSSGVTEWFLRFWYVSPIPTLSADADVLEAPDGFVEALQEWVSYQAMRGLMRGALSDLERLQAIGMVSKNSIDSFTYILKTQGVRMQWPSLER